MGCKSTKESKDLLIGCLENIKCKIDTDNLTVPKQLIYQLEPKINERFIKVNQLDFTPLAYALYRGKYKAFRYIYEILNGNLGIMENLLMTQGC